MNLTSRVSLVILMTLFALEARASLVYTSSKFKPESAKMVVVIHGCLQNAEAMALGTGWNQLAEQHNLVIVYPQVPAGTNPYDCWNWFLPENQRPDSGQLKGIMDEIQAVKQSLKLKKPPLFAAGISSGGTMVAGLLACYPKAFQAGAIHSGTSYGLAQNAADAQRVLKEGPLAEAPKPPCRPADSQSSVLVIHGATDPIVNPVHATRIITDFIGHTNVASSKTAKQGETAYAITDYGSGHGKRGRLVMVQGLGHAWSGHVLHLRHAALLGPKGKMPTVLPFFSEIGPSATNLMWEFFSQ